MKTAPLILSAQSRLTLIRRYQASLLILSGLGYLLLLSRIGAEYANSLAFLLFLVGLVILLFAVYRRGYFKPVAINDAARALDQHFALKDRLVTLVSISAEFGQIKKSEQPAKIEFVEQQVIESLPTEIKLDQVIPFWLPPWLRKLTYSLAPVWLALLILWIFDPFASHDKVAFQQARLIDKVLIDNPTLPEPVKEALQNLSQSLQQEPLTNQQVLEALEAAENEIDQVENQISESSEGTVVQAGERKEAKNTETGSQQSKKDFEQASRSETPTPVATNPASRATPTPELQNSATPSPSPQAATKKDASEKPEPSKQENQEQKDSSSKTADDKNQPGNKNQGQGNQNSQQPAQNSQEGEQGQSGGQSGSQGQGEGQEKKDGQGGGQSGSQQSGKQGNDSNQQSGKEGGKPGSEGQDQGTDQSSQSGSQSGDGKQAADQKDGQSQKQDQAGKQEGKTGEQSGSAGAGSEKKQGLDAAKDALDQLRKQIDQQKQGQSEKGPSDPKNGKGGNQANAAAQSGQKKSESAQKSDSGQGSGQGKKPKDQPQGTKAGADEKNSDQNQNTEKPDNKSAGAPSSGKNDSDPASPSSSKQSGPGQNKALDPHAPAQDFKSEGDKSTEVLGGGQRAYKETAISGDKEQFDTRFTDQQGRVVKNKKEATPVTNIDQVKLAKPEAIKDAAEQPIPLEYREMLQ